MRTWRFSLMIPAVLALAALPAQSQSVISAQSGLVHYAEGKVLAGDTAVEPKFGQFPQLKQQEVLRTEEGRAEVLLNPGVFLRVGENSSVRMLSTLLTDSRVEFLGGNAVVESPSLEKGNAVTIVYKDTVVSIVKSGIYRFDGEPAEMRVFDGEALAEGAGQRVVVKKGKTLALDGSMLVRKFDPELTDALDRWSSRRSENLAMANVYAARSIADYGYSWNSSGWFFNRYLGLYTFVPLGGVYTNPYGYRFWSPEQVYAVYYTPQASHGGGKYSRSLGYNTVPMTSTGNSGTLSVGAKAPTTATSAPSAPISRDTGRAGGRSR